MKSHESDATGLLSETTTMEQIVQRCVTDQKFWPHNVLDQLLVHRLVPNRFGTSNTEAQQFPYHQTQCVKFYFFLILKI